MLRYLTLMAACTTLTLGVSRAEPPREGNWLLAQVSPTAEIGLYLLKVEANDGQLTAEVIATQRGTGGADKPTIKKILANEDGSIAITFTQFNTDLTFEGTKVKTEQAYLGSFGTDERPQRAKLVFTESETIDRTNMILNKPVPPYTKALTIQNLPLRLQTQIRQEEDEEKRKALLEELAEARKQIDTIPDLYRETIEKFTDSAASYDAALALLRTAARANVTLEEAKQLVALIEQKAARYGERFAKSARLQTAQVVANEKQLATLAVKLTRETAAALTEADPTNFKVEVYTALKTALTNAGLNDELQPVIAQLDAFEAILDKEYLATVPPFKPTVFEGRTKKDANQVVVMELFTGAQCPPCVAADVAFDALGDTYKPSEVLLLQYHMHIPGPDPLTNLDTIARWNYYSKLFPNAIRGTPSTLFNGKPEAGGGGGMANAEGKYKQYRGIIEPMLEETTKVSIVGTATRDGDKINIAVEVVGADAEKPHKLRFVLVEETIKYVGGNRLRFHHHVVRATPGGAEGIAIKQEQLKHTLTVDLVEVKQTITKYLDEYAQERPFPNANRPLDLNELQLIALVQDDETGAIVQAAKLPLAKTTVNR